MIFKLCLRRDHYMVVDSGLLIVAYVNDSLCAGMILYFEQNRNMGLRVRASKRDLFQHSCTLIRTTTSTIIR